MEPFHFNRRRSTLESKVWSGLTPLLVYLGVSAMLSQGEDDTVSAPETKWAPPPDYGRDGGTGPIKAAAAGGAGRSIRPAHLVECG